MSDAEYVAQLRDRIDAVYLAIIELDDSLHNEPYDPVDAAAKRETLRRAGSAAVDAAGSRMMRVAVKYGLLDPPAWGVPLVQLLSGWDFVTDTQPRIGQIQDRYHKLNDLSRLLSADSATPSDSILPATPTEPNDGRTARRGRKRGTDPTTDRNLLDLWEKAKSQRISLKEFESREGVGKGQVAAAQARIRAAKNRADKRGAN